MYRTIAAASRLEGEWGKCSSAEGCAKQEHLAQHDLARPRQGHDSVPGGHGGQALLHPSSNSHPGPAWETSSLFHRDRVICRRISTEKAIMTKLRFGDIHGSAFIVQRAGRVVAVLIPGLCHAQVYPWPLVHHGDRQPVQTVLTALETERQR
ncbi:hypothetical protein EYF80_007297 [Liparis tanakae]|uniref:Uncharacterized protein n=1 Tax=Liparis tanakae TaxID=230148 RepID=A0A4Z2IYT6_9TELE|nr:hypothetical protein EYF80_007297 [Liparis tanakae]